ncbi:E3 ubiquitin-protein ligase PRT1 [Vitis vinifera]|uniref:E3 ubiquitin-protein ligase PRT1 n=1 Tax=Vitis vinifera TaxID=29760 RepID=A0A438CQX2_VITVI|nr:E3 ubiquitin-protein ligase PRT1 [Vitis vinifera]
MMCPIIGDRYRCKDCKEKIGFDLCGDCYNTNSKLPGRFNQQHTQSTNLSCLEQPGDPTAAFVSLDDAEETAENAAAIVLDDDAEETAENDVNGLAASDAAPEL